MTTQRMFVERWRGAVRAAVAASVREQGGNNRGAQIETYQRACGGEPGESWCLDMLTFYALKEMASENLGAGQVITADTVVALCRAQWSALESARHVPVTGSCGAACAFYAAHGLLTGRADIQEIKPGWLVFYAWAQADIAGGVPRHVGMCDAQWRRGARPIASLEGNTSDGTGSQSDGDGCFRRFRHFANVVAIARTY